MWVRSVLVAGSTVLAATFLLLTGCSSTQETARNNAVTAVRAEARSVRDHIAAAARDKAGAAQVEAVRAVLPGPWLMAARHDDGLVVTGALVADAHAGGGLTYQGFTARLCLRFIVAEGTGGTDVVDVPCPRRAEVESPADETVTLT